MENLILYDVPYTKKRIGKAHDGGYCIIELPNEPPSDTEQVNKSSPYDLFISGGISDDISFEIALLNIYPHLHCIAFDNTINSLPGKHHNLKYIKKNLGNTNTQELTNLDEYICDYKNVFMKIDIEGHEFRLLPSLIANNHMEKIKQLIVEIHTPGDIHLYPNYFAGLSDITNDTMFTMFNNINKTHTLVHFHANNGCNMQYIDTIPLPHVFELTYIRNDFVSSRTLNKQPLPMSIDMKNIPSKPDYSLSGFPYTA